MKPRASLRIALCHASPRLTFWASHSWAALCVSLQHNTSATHCPTARGRWAQPPFCSFPEVGKATTSSEDGRLCFSYIRRSPAHQDISTLTRRSFQLCGHRTTCRGAGARTQPGSTKLPVSSQQAVPVNPSSAKVIRPQLSSSGSWHRETLKQSVCRGYENELIPTRRSILDGQHAPKGLMYDENSEFSHFHL